MKLVILFPVAIALPLMPPAFAQAPSEPPPAAAAQPPAPRPDDLDARLHHQPTQAEVNEREKARQSAATVDQRNKEQQKQVDDLYQQLLGKPAAK
jgi:hypothetical protein